MGSVTALVTIVTAGLSFWTVRSLQRVIDDAYDRDVKKQVTPDRNVRS